MVPPVYIMRRDGVMEIKGFQGYNVTMFQGFSDKGSQGYRPLSEAEAQGYRVTGLQG